jgi:hypothetical protein
MSRVLEYQIKGKSDVEQVVGRAKASVGQLQQITDTVTKKFGEIGKDFAMRFLAPMALFQSFISMIQADIAKAKQEAKEGLDLIAKGETAFANSEEKRMAAYFKAKKEREEEMRMVEAGKKEAAAQFMQTAEGQALAEKMAAERIANLGATAGLDFEAFKNSLKADKEFQRAAVNAFMKSDEGRAVIGPKPANALSEARAVSGNVIGVGQSPVIAAMNETNDLLRQIATNTTPSQAALTPDPNLTSKTTVPSRAALLMGR